MSRANHRCSPFDIPVPKDWQGLIPPASSPVAEERAPQHHRNLICTHTGAFYRGAPLQQAGPAPRISVLESSPAWHCSLLPIPWPQLHHWPSLTSLWHLTLLRLFVPASFSIEKSLKFLSARALIEYWELPRLSREQEHISWDTECWELCRIGKKLRILCVCFPRQAEAGDGQSKALPQAGSAVTGETAPGGHIFLGPPKIICATVASKARPALSPAVPGCRDGGLHKTSL